MKFEKKLAEEVAEGVAGFKAQIQALTGDSPQAVLRQALQGMALQVAVSTSEDVHVENTSFKNSEGMDIRLRVYSPKEIGNTLPCLYWMHGGGTISGLPDQEDSMLYQMALDIGCVVVSVDYRLAPEHPYPAPINDCFEGLLHVSNYATKFHIDANKIAVGGASAGGLLSASCALLARQKGGVKILHQSLTYPMLDHRGSSESSQQITDVGIWDTEINTYAFGCYLKDVIENLPPLAVPALVEDLSNLPSAFVAVGTMDCLRDESIEYANRLAQHGVQTELHVYPGMPHVFDSLAPQSKAARDFYLSRNEAIKRAFLLG